MIAPHRRKKTPSSKQNIRQPLMTREQWDEWRDFCYVVGVRTMRCVKSLARFARLLWRPIAYVLGRLMGVILGRFRTLKAEWRRIAEGFRIAGDKMHVSHSMSVLLSVMLTAVRRHRRVVIGLLNIVLPTAAAVVLAVTVGYWWRADYALSLNYRGVDIGYIAAEDVFVNAATAIKGSVINADGAFVVDRTPTMTLQVVAGQSILTEQETQDKLLSTMSDTLMDGAGLYVDGTFRGALDSKQTIQSLLDTALQKHETGKYDGVDFLGEVEIVEGTYPISSKSDEQTIREYLSSLPVKMIKNTTYTETVKCTTVYLQDSSLPLGYETSVSKGADGKQRVHGQIIYVNGKEMYRTIVSAEMIKAPTNRVVKIGAQTYSDTSVIGDGKATGRFIWPLPYTKQISSPFATRWGRLHGAIDIANGSTNGKPIIASDGGTVVEAEYRGSYGYYVLIDHGNGFKTRYAHCSKLTVEAGQKVAQGQYIANVGNTGYSFGAHLHFEVIKNGVLVDPLDYVER